HGSLSRSQFELLSQILFYVEAITVDRTQSFLFALVDIKEKLLNYTLFLSALLLQGENEHPLVPPYDLIQSKDDPFTVSGLITPQAPVQLHSVAGPRLFRNNSEAIGERFSFVVNPPDQYSSAPTLFAIPTPSPSMPASPISMEAPSYIYQYRVAMNLALVLNLLYKSTVIHYDTAQYLAQLPYFPSLLVTLMCVPVNIPTSQVYSARNIMTQIKLKINIPPAENALEILRLLDIKKENDNVSLLFKLSGLVLSKTSTAHDLVDNGLLDFCVKASKLENRELELECWMLLVRVSNAIDNEENIIKSTQNRPELIFIEHRSVIMIIIQQLSIEIRTEGLNVLSHIIDRMKGYQLVDLEDYFSMMFQPILEFALDVDENNLAGKTNESEKMIRNKAKEMALQGMVSKMLNDIINRSYTFQYSRQMLC
ncbi:MAG: hypothetical protein EZS28_004390, partial [Streblomastix strix]